MFSRRWQYLSAGQCRPKMAWQWWRRYCDCLHCWNGWLRLSSQPCTAQGTCWQHLQSTSQWQVPIDRCWSELDLSLCPTQCREDQDCPLSPIEKYNIKLHNIYGTDEVGIQAQGGGEHKYIFDAHKKAAPYQQHARTQDNITVIVMICTDGTSTPPAAIFKGSAYQVKWGENNPLNALYVTSAFIIYIAIANPRLGLATRRKARPMVKLVPPGWRFSKNKHKRRQMESTSYSSLMATTCIILLPSFCLHASI